jgi:hypothetical protein
MSTLLRVTIVVELTFSLIVFIIGFYSLFTGVKLWWIPLVIGVITAFTGFILFMTYRRVGQFKSRGKHG